MDKNLIIIAFLFFTMQYNFGQDILTDTSKYIATYNLSFQKDSTDVKTKKNEKFFLLIGQKYSLFESFNKRYNDSLKNAIAKKYTDFSLAVSKAITSSKMSRFNFKILKSKDKTLVFDSYFSNKFIYEDKDPLNWKITNKRKAISGYNCVLATTNFGGRKYHAWFTPEIPISTGPYKFKGLPGLIVKIEDDKKQYVFQLESFQKKKEKFIFDTKAGIKVTKKKFYNAYNTFKKSFIAQLNQRGVAFDNATSRQLQKRVQKSRNNEIEIKY